MNSPAYFESTQIPMFGPPEIIGFGSAELRVMEIPRDVANEIIKRNHYSKVVYAGSYIHLGVYKDSELLGVLQLGAAMNPASQASVVSGTAQDEYLELNRMWLSECLPRNSESRAISYSLKYVRRKLPKIAWVQSFADERCGKFGVVYQAANFIYCGEHRSTFWEIDGDWYHNSLMTRDPRLTPKARFVQENKQRAVAHVLRQFRYVFFLRRGFENRLLLKRAAYPKHAVEVSEAIRPDSIGEGWVRSPVTAPSTTTRTA